MVTLSRPRPDGPFGTVDRIDVIEFLKESALLKIITTFSSTVVTNIMSWNKVYAINAAPTFIHRQMYITNLPLPYRWTGTDNHSSLMDRYTRRGWKHTNFEKVETGPDLGKHFSGTRMLADSKTWQICLDRGGENESASSDGTLEAMSWDYSAHSCAQDRLDSDRLDFVKAQNSSYSHPCLEQKHYFGGWREQRWQKDWQRLSWPKYLTVRLDKALAEQVSKLDPEDLALLLKHLLLQTTDFGDSRETWRAMQAISEERKSAATVRKRPDFKHYEHMLVRWFLEWRRGPLNFDKPGSIKWLN